MPARLAKLTLRGFKTFRDLTDFEPGPLTVLIGPNGAGKSNFISFFRFLARSFVPPGNLQVEVGQLGGASALLHDGPAKTRRIEAALTFETEAGGNDYKFSLSYAAGDTLIYARENYGFSRTDLQKTSERTWLEPGPREAQLISQAESGVPAARTILALLRNLRVFQFHNTSWTARIRNKWSEDDGRWLKEDAANLAPFLYRLRNSEPPYYRRIVQTLRLILPFFADFELEPEHGMILLRLHVIAEGQAEETFVNRVLVPHLGSFEISTDVHCVTTSRQGGRPFRGGMHTYAQPRRDLELWMKQDQRRDARFTTLFDLYALAIWRMSSLSRSKQSRTWRPSVPLTRPPN